MHDLWNDRKYNVAASRIDFVQTIRDKHPDELTNQELNYIAFTSMTTMGGAPTLRFALPRFFAAYFAKPQDGWIVDPEGLMGKLQLAGIERWTSEDKAAALQALIAFAQSEQELAVEETVSRGGDEVDALDPAIVAVTAWAVHQLTLPLS